MNCKNCGANVPENEMECPFCGTAIDNPADSELSLGNKSKIRSNNPFVGKEYSFSGNDLIVRGRWGVRYKITVGEDRLQFETTPPKKNKVPVVMLDDILAIDESFHMRTFNIILGILGIVLGFVGGLWGFLLPIAVVLLYRERKMKIHVRNGNIITVYSDTTAAFSEFIDDMKKITKINQ